MKLISPNIFLRVFLAMIASVALTGCYSTVFENQGDCDPVHIIRFNYDRNMKFADAFPHEVPSVDLFVFDTEGRLVTTVSRDVDREHAKDFTIELRDLKPGHYNLLAWCGVKDSKHFRVNPNSEPDPAIHHHLCRISREEPNVAENEEAGGHIREDIGRLYHGRLENEDMTADEGTHVHTIDLTKDTNVIRVVLQHLSGEEMNKDDYRIVISDANGFYDHRNDLLPDMDLTYHPWSQESGMAWFHPEDAPDDESRAQTSASAVVSELTVGRLMADRKKDVYLRVYNAYTGEKIVNIRLIEYLLMVKGNYYTDYGITPMSDQEYLDRQDEYPMTFFLDNNNKWIKTVIYINAWRIVRNESDIH